MKNRRDVCYAKDGGYITFDGLPHSIKTGCQATPAYKSRFCEQHKPFVCDSQEATGMEEIDAGNFDAPIGPIIRSTQKNQEPGREIIELILAKKVTRQQTYYKVHNI